MNSGRCILHSKQQFTTPTGCLSQPRSESGAQEIERSEAAHFSAAAISACREAAILKSSLGTTSSPELRPNKRMHGVRRLGCPDEQAKSIAQGLGRASALLADIECEPKKRRPRNTHRSAKDLRKSISALRKSQDRKKGLLP